MRSQYFNDHFPQNEAGTKKKWKNSGAVKGGFASRAFNAWLIEVVLKPGYGYLLTRMKCWQVVFLAKCSVLSEVIDLRLGQSQVTGDDLACMLSKWRSCGNFDFAH